MRHRSTRSRRALGAVSPLLALIAQSCLLPEVEFSDEPAQDQGSLVGQNPSANAGGASSTGGTSSGAGGTSSGAGGSSALGLGGSAGTPSSGGGVAGAGDQNPPTDLSPTGSGGSSSTAPAPGLACQDGSLSTGESDIDCGGACAPCADGSACNTDDDCRSARCQGGECAQQASCSDGAQNQDESGADCGGNTCTARCAAGLGCRAEGDCLAGLSCSNGVCAAPSCNDARQNGDESGLDCGGSCPACATGASCRAASDCASLSCSAGLCAAPSCTDAIQNQGEVALDCGGPCGPCAVGQACTTNTQCATNLCGAGACPAGVARCCQPDPCPGAPVCDAGQRRCSNDGDSLEVCNECQNGFDALESCPLGCASIAGTFLCDLPISLPSLPGL
jgi:hypothetical protein